MEKHEIKLKYKELVRQGKDKEANELLNLIRVGNYEKVSSLEVKEEKEVESTKKKQKKVEFETIDDLLKIDGIGSKNIKKIKRVTNAIEKLKELIKTDSLPLRDDIVIKLKDSLK
jgi:predicted flap endonuclease-1-like 5' DNA nuclease